MDRTMESQMEGKEQLEQKAEGIWKPGPTRKETVIRQIFKNNLDKMRHFNNPNRECELGERYILTKLTFFLK